jgi:predicted esterase
MCCLLVVAACSARVPAASDAAAPDVAVDVAAADVPRAIDADLTGPTDVPAVPCTGAPADVYTVSPAPGAALGAILACAPDGSLSLADAGMKIGSGMTATSAVAMFRIAYATRDRAGHPAVSTARVYLPSTPRARPVPIVVAAHGSVGIADSCVPSTDIDSALPLPYAARGFAAIAPDLAGLGNAGTQDYLDNHAQGWQLLDGARALRALLAPGLAADALVLTGYSQGGGAVLSAHSLVHADPPGVGTVVATVAYAPQWPIRLASFDYENILRMPTELTVSEGISNSSVAVLRQYAFFENMSGGHGVDAFPLAARFGLKLAVDGECLVPLGGYIQGTMLHAGDLIDSSLRTGVVSCIDGGACTGDAATYYQFLLDNVLAPDPQAGPVLLVQGLLDQIMPAAHEAACVRDKLVAAGVDLETCVFANSDHTNIMDQHASGEAWAESVLAGGARASCDPSTTLPSCQ